MTGEQIDALAARIADALAESPVLIHRPPLTASRGVIRRIVREQLIVAYNAAQENR